MRKETAVVCAISFRWWHFLLPWIYASLTTYAPTTGSALTSGIILGVFALGTAPALLALGFVSGSLKGKLGDWF